MSVSIARLVQDAIKEGYSEENAEAKVCQDLVLEAIAESPLAKNATIKGGVVMHALSKSARRTTLDIDIDFIRYSIENDSLDSFFGASELSPRHPVQENCSL